MRRLLLPVVAVAALAATAASPTAASPAPAAPARQGASRAVVIVDTGGGVHRTVITFSGSISGLGALQAAGANPETLDYGGGLGHAVCKLYGVGDDATPSTCPGGWRYYRATGGAGGWSYSGAGPSNTTVRDGDVEGWGYNRTPPFSSFCSVAGCAPPPPPPPAPGGGSGGAGSGGSGSGGGGPGPGGGGTGGGGVIPPVPIPPELATTTTVAPGTPDETAPGGSDAQEEDAQEEKERKDKERDRELATELTSDHGGGGPPASLLLFLVVLAALVAGTLLARRARRDRAAKPADT